MIASEEPAPRDTLSSSPTNERHPQVRQGYVVAGKYELLHLLGRGSMGEVWIAHHRSLGEKVALKLLTRPPSSVEFESGATIAARFRFEAQVAARLSRKTRHIVCVTDHGEENGIAYLVMELLDGETLEARLISRGPLTPDEVSVVIRQTARALAEAHEQGVIHRDLKPANIFLAHDEDGGLLVKLLDFGIARATPTRRAADPFSTEDGLVCGTPGYMSPEQGRALEVDPRCDLWALATVAYEALTSNLPLRGGTSEELLDNLRAGNFVGVHQHDASLPQGLEHFFRCAFATRIEDRFSSATDVARAFELAIGNGATREVHPSTRKTPWRMPSALTSCEPTIVGVPRRAAAGKRRVRPTTMAIVGFALALATGAAAGTVSRMSKSVSPAASRAVAGRFGALGGCAQGFVETRGGRCLAVSSGATEDAGAVSDGIQTATPLAPPATPARSNIEPPSRVTPTSVPAVRRRPRPVDRSAVL